MALKGEETERMRVLGELTDDLHATGRHGTPPSGFTRKALYLVALEMELIQREMKSIASSLLELVLMMKEDRK